LLNCSTTPLQDVVKTKNLHQYGLSLQQKMYFCVCKRTGFVNHMFRDFVTMDSDSSFESVIATCVESSHSVRAVTRVEPPSFRNVTSVPSMKILHWANVCFVAH